MYTFTQNLKLDFLLFYVTNLGGPLKIMWLGATLCQELSTNLKAEYFQRGYNFATHVHPRPCRLWITTTYESTTITNWISSRAFSDMFEWTDILEIRSMKARMTLVRQTDLEDLKCASLPMLSASWLCFWLTWPPCFPLHSAFPRQWQLHPIFP
jgi:hypothetical protein